MIRAMTFDCWDTLIADDDSRSKQRKKYIYDVLNEKGFPISQDEIDDLFSKEAKFFENHIIEHKKTHNSRERVKTILKLAGIHLPSDDIDEIAEYSDKVALDFPPPVVSGIRDVLEVLAEKYKLAVICNTGWHSSGTVRQLLKEKDLPKYFSHLTFSDEAGVAKPHKQIFEFTVGKLGCRPEDAAHIGDSEYSDIVGAKQAHMRAILFTGINAKWKDNNTADLVVSSYDNFLDVFEEMNW